MAIPTLAVLAGSLPGKLRRRVTAWARTHMTQLIAEWNRCNSQMPIRT
jgi:hypothetical protein